MRLTYSGTSLINPRKDLRERLQWIRDIGFRVVGGSVDPDMTDDDIKYVRDIFGEMGMAIGECYFNGATCIYSPNNEKYRESFGNLIKAIPIAGKLGVDHIQCSIGSMDPNNEWLHHPDNFSQRALDLLVDSARKLVPIAEDSQCLVSPECTQWTIVYNPERMKEYVDRIDSPYMKINLDIVNILNNERVYDNGSFAKCAVAFLGERIGSFHVKDVIVRDILTVSHIDEVPMGTGILDHKSVIQASTLLEPWKTFVLEHIQGDQLIQPTYDHIRKAADSIGHRWTDPLCTRKRWEEGL